MPQIGGIYVPDDILMPRANVPGPRRGLGAIFGAALEGTARQVGAALPYQFDVLTQNQVDPASEASYKRGLEQSRAAFARAPAASVDDLTSGRVGFARFALENLTASAPQTLATLGGTVAGAVAGGPAGAVLGGVATGTPLFSASNVARQVEERGSLDVASAERALSVAPFQAASDVLAERFLPGAGRLFGAGAATQTGGFLARTAKAIAKAGATEAVTEAGQQVGERYAAGLPTGSADAVHEYVNAAVTAFVVGGVLGSGGGFRRMAADAKPSAVVTPEDMIAKIDAMTSSEQLALPAPTDVYVDATGAASVNPSGNLQLALPSPETFAGPDAYTDTTGTTAVAPQGPIDLMIERNRPQNLVNTDLSNLTPEVRALLDQVAAPAGTPLTASTALSSAPVLGFDPAAQEAPAPLIPVAEDAAPVDFQQHVTELKKGLRGGFVQEVTGADELELINKTYDQIFIDQDTRSNTAKFAQRLGLVDENLEPTPLAQQIEAERAAAAAETTEPAAPAEVATAVEPLAAAPDQAQTFAASWEAIKKSAGIQRLTSAAELNTPPDLRTAQVDVFRALATDTSKAEVSQIEKLGKKLGLITDNDARDVTPLGRQAFLNSPEGATETLAAAQQQGVSQTDFERGVRSEIDGVEAPDFDSFEAAAAHEAGREWARDFVENGDVKTFAQTEAVRSRQARRENGEAVDRSTEASRVTLTPPQIQQRALNTLLDSADLTAVADTDAQALRRMVRSGATPTEVGQALEQVQRGETLFTQPASAETNLSEVGRQLGRGAPRDPALLANTDRVVVAPKAQRVGESQAAIDRYNAVESAKQGIRDAVENGDITPRERISMLARLFGGDLAGVQEVLSGRKSLTFKMKSDVSRRDFLAGAAAAGVLAVSPVPSAATVAKTTSTATADFTKLLRAGDVEGALREIMRVGKPMYRLIASKILKGGIDGISLSVVDEAMTAYGVTRLNDAATAAITLFEGGQDHETFMHEMIHAFVMRRWATISVYGLKSNRTKLGVNEGLSDVAIDGFVKLWDQIGGALKVTNPELLEQQVWADQVYADPDEALAWIMTNPDAQTYLKTVDMTGKKITSGETLWDRFVSFVRGVLGLPATPAATAALDTLMGAGLAVLDVGRGVDDSFAVKYMKRRAVDAGRVQARLRDVPRSVAETNDATKEIVASLSAATSKIKALDLPQKLRRLGLGFLSQNQLDRLYGAAFPGMVQRSDALRQQGAVRGRWQGLGNAVNQNFDKLPSKTRDGVSNLMSIATRYGFDPDKAFEDHTHLGFSKGADGRVSIDPAKAQEVARLRPIYAEVQKLKNDLSRGDGAGIKVFNEFRMLNEAQNYARMASLLHERVATDPELSLGVASAAVNPVDQFMLKQDLEAPEAVRTYWQKALLDQVERAQDFINEKNGSAANGTAQDVRDMKDHLSPIEEQIQAVYTALAGMRNGVYFHLGRFGDYYGSATIRMVNGQADPVATKHIAEVLSKAGFDDIQIDPDSTQSRLAARFTTSDQTKRFRDVMLDLQKGGWLEPKTEIKAAPRSQTENYAGGSQLPTFIASYIQRIKADPAYVPDSDMSPKEIAGLERRRDEAVKRAVDTWLEQQPDNSISKVLAKRENVQGSNLDMVRNFNHRWQVGGASIAASSAAPKISAAYVAMRAQLNQAAIVNTDPTKTQEDPFLINDLMREIKKRDATIPINEVSDAFDKARAYSHAYFLGLSPAYALLNMSQLLVTGLPELAKVHGYARSFHAMRRASPVAFQIIKAVSEEARALGSKHAADVAITGSVLAKAGLSVAEQNFVRHMLATGTIDIGTAAHALAQVDEGRAGSKTDIALKYASVLGAYTETFSRLTMALAARDLHGSKPDVEVYATKVVSNSMFDYQTWNTARQLGKQGFAGPVTPLLTQFMSYSIQLTEKLYSEALDAFSRARPGETLETAKQRKTEARRFLLGHLTAVTALAGTLGLPFATVFATVIEKLVDAVDDDDEPYDATAAWRGFLSDILGQEVGEILARGLPRGAGGDISARAGEQNLLPFSEFLADKRGWKEAVSSSAGKSIGAVPSMFMNVLSGGDKIADGDVLGGMKEMLPVAFKGPTEVYRMTTEGYVDTKGNKLPLTPAASSYLVQLLGITPAAKAEYSEARGDQQARRGEISRQADTLRKQIVKAMLTGDRDTATELVARAQEFDRDNPAFGVVKSIPAALSQQAQAQARARALNSPLGVSANDVAGQQLTRYANY